MKIGAINSSAHRAIERTLADNGYSLIWSANTGTEARRAFERAPPDVMLVPAGLADTSAAEFTRWVLSQGGCEVLVLSEGKDRRVSEIYEAMGAGALDVVIPPRLDEQGRLSGAEALLGKLRTVARLLGRPAEFGTAPTTTPFGARRGPPLVAIGSSTGGPQALLTLLSHLPKGFPAAIIIVQHIDRDFVDGLASWLREGSGLRVEVAADGAAPTAGTALIAGTEDHLVMTTNGALRYRAEPKDQIYRPSVDVFFSSLVDHWPSPGIAVLLTGMGKDGAEGLRKLRQAKWHTLAQDEASSAVYGMPKAAAQLGAACKVLPPIEIAKEIESYLARGRGR